MDAKQLRLYRLKMKRKRQQKQKNAEEKKKKLHTNDISFSGLLVKATPTDTTKFKSNKLMDLNIIPKHPFSLSILGTTGSGKTHLLSYMLNNTQMYKNYFDKVIVFGRTIHADGTYKFIKKDEVVSNNMSDRLDELVEQLDKESKEMQFNERDNLLVIFEDISAEKKLLKNPNLGKLFVQNRHYKTSVISLSHYYKRLNPMIRLNARHLMIFKCNATQIDLLSEDYKIRDKHSFFAMVRHAFEPTKELPRPFLYVNNVDPKNKFRKSFSEFLTLEK